MSWFSKLRLQSRGSDTPTAADTALGWRTPFVPVADEEPETMWSEFNLSGLPQGRPVDPLRPSGSD
ncbi:MAG TPA: hypothetical protein VE715_16635 [Blastocatellia bacterium]|nr:hypothetical protein [Blastocatellia bacterium]